MTQIGLQSPRIQALVRQCVAASMPKHVRMYLKDDRGFLAGTRELGEARRGERATTLRSEDKGRGSARDSSPKSGCVASWPPFARRTCILPVSHQRVRRRDCKDFQLMMSASFSARTPND
jgi:hypothetical protein